MDWYRFHNPDISWPVIKRRVGLEFMELLELSALFLSRGGWGIMNRSCFPSDKAYRSAKSRLSHQGLIASTSVGGAAPEIRLTDAGRDRMPPYFQPEKQWTRSWNKVWYLLIYDVPEVDRRYRNVLRQFLKRKQLGLLQQSVWVTPQDIRPDFDDLCKAANIDSYAYLLEAKTFLGLPSRSIVEHAWDFDRLGEVQNHFCEVGSRNIDLLQSHELSPPDLAALLRECVSAYHSVMSEDPLLPEALLPKDYSGKAAYETFQTLLQEIHRQSEALHLK